MILGRKYLLLILLLLLSLLLGCTKEQISPLELLDLALAADEDHPVCEIYFEKGEDENRLDETDLLTLYNGEDPTKLATSYAICLGKDDRVYEIHLFQLADDQNRESLKKILYKRIDLIQNKEIYLYDPENYETVSSFARVFEKGRILALLITPQPETIQDVLKAQIGGW
jgi:hypothetical protein